MLTIDGKSINPNEEIRREFRKFIDDNSELEINELYDKMYDMLCILKDINYPQYELMVELMYQELYCYHGYLVKTNEIDSDFRERNDILDAFKKEHVISCYEENVDFFLEEFTYIMKLNNLFHARLLLELNKEQRKHLKKITSFYMYDEMALNNYIGFRILEDYFLENIEDKHVLPEELIQDIINFLEYLSRNHQTLYEKCINDILKKSYKWSYYYVNNSIDIEETDLELQVVRLTCGKTLEEASQELIDNKQLLGDILQRIFEDMDLGYPAITTKNGEEIITEEQLNNYVIKLSKNK